MYLFNAAQPGIGGVHVLGSKQVSNTFLTSLRSEQLSLLGHFLSGEWFLRLESKGLGGGPQTQRGVTAPRGWGPRPWGPKTGSPKTRGSQDRGVPRQSSVPDLQILGSLGISRIRGTQTQGTLDWGVPRRSSVPDLLIIFQQLILNIILPTSWAAFWDKSLPFALFMQSWKLGYD